MKNKRMVAADRNRLLEHYAALHAIVRELTHHKEEILRCAYKPTLTARDLGKIYSALNCLLSCCSTPEAHATESTLRRFGLKIDEARR